MALASYGSALESVYQAGADPGRWNQALAKVDDHVGGCGALIAYHDLEADRGFIVTERLREDLAELYIRRYGRNPYSVEILSRTPGTVHLGSALVDRAVITRTEFHADIFAAQRIAEHLMCSHAGFVSARTTGGFAVMLDQRGADDAGPRQRRMARLSPHLSAAVELSNRVAQLPLWQRRLDSILEAMRVPAMIVDWNWRIERLNSAADALLTSENGLSVEQDMVLTASLAAERPGLTRVLAAASGPEAMPQLYRLARPIGVPLLLKATPLSPSVLEMWYAPRGSTAILVQIVDPAERVHPFPGGPLQHLFGLTAAEARVALLVGAGLSTPDAATALGLAVTTVRTHLARIFDKLDIRSQAALARLLAALDLLK